MLDAKQNELIVTIRIPRICHYTPYLWQIDDKPSIDKNDDMYGMSMGEIETGQDTVAIGYLGEGE